jgi:hypothetical protein
MLKKPILKIAFTLRHFISTQSLMIMNTNEISIMEMTPNLDVDFFEGSALAEVVDAVVEEETVDEVGICVVFELAVVVGDVDVVVVVVVVELESLQIFDVFSSNIYAHPFSLALFSSIISNESFAF